MNLTDIDLNLLKVFEAMTQTRSVSKAAVSLGIGQPAMSTALNRLRKVLGDELFVRVGGTMQPTPRAAKITPDILTALAQLRAVLAGEIAFDAAMSKRTFTLASTDYTSYVLGPALMADVALTAPYTDIRMIGYDKDDVPQLIDSGDIDVALGVFPNAPERAVRTLLCEEHFVGLARADHPSLRDGAMALADYVAAGHALVSMRRDARGQIDKALAELGLARRIALTLPHMLALPPILLSSSLLAAIPQRVAARIDDPRLAVFCLPVALSSWRIEMLWNASSRDDPAARWLRNRVAMAAALA